MDTIKYGAAFMDGISFVQETTVQELEAHKVHRPELSADLKKLKVFYLPNHFLFLGVEKAGVSWVEGSAMNMAGHLLVQVEDGGPLWSALTITHWDQHRAIRQLEDNMDLVIDLLGGRRYLTDHAEFSGLAKAYIADRYIIHPSIFEHAQYHPLLPQPAVQG